MAYTGPIVAGSALVSRDVSRVVGLVVRALRAHATGDPMRDRLSVEALTEALDELLAIDARRRAGGE